MSASISFHGPYACRWYHYGPGEVELHPEPYSSLHIEDGQGSDVILFFDGRDGLDALIKAALAARDQWPAPESPEWDADGYPLNAAAADQTIIRALPRSGAGTS